MADIKKLAFLPLQTDCKSEESSSPGNFSPESKLLRDLSFSEEARGGAGTGGNCIAFLFGDRWARFCGAIGVDERDRCCGGAVSYTHLDVYKRQVE
ncbi:hypothetical protein T4E_7171 [Trichinella pseudospiralis]|uniref:Uncharacterized protein n=1 Tax=Trichinella pseudospiralis TaxID=6337 RepID=A0A0V0XTR0_TRIPS|nr:hypothetical protein T4E_7171 [Trichinella pseudospiralis]